MTQFEFGKWYPVETGPTTPPRSAETIEVLLTAKDFRRAVIGCIYELGDGGRKAVASGFHGFEWTHWSPLPPVFEGE